MRFLRPRQYPRRIEVARDYVEVLQQVPLQVLARRCAERTQTGRAHLEGCREALEALLLRRRLERLWAAVAMEAIRFEGMPARQALERADRVVGATTGERRGKAARGELDALVDVLHERQLERENLHAQAFEKIRSAREHRPTQEVSELLRALRRIPGRKRVTIVVNNEVDAFDVERLDRTGQALLAKKLDEALAARGSMLVRQRIPGGSRRESRQTAAEEQDVHRSGRWSALYAVLLTSGTWYPMPAELVEECCNQDPQGSPLPPEERVLERVLFRDFADFCDASRAPVRRAVGR